MWVRRLRLGSGLMIGIFLITHLFSHSTGLVSFETAETVRKSIGLIWQSAPGTVLLYGSFIVHILLVYWHLYERNNLRMGRGEILQIATGLAIPLLLAGHVAATRITYENFGIGRDYTWVMLGTWVESGWPLIKHTLMLLLTWAHLCIGLHLWLRFKPGYDRAVRLLYPLALFMPLLTWLGYARMGVETEGKLQQPGWIEAYQSGLGVDLGQIEPFIFANNKIIIGSILGFLAVTFLARHARILYQRQSGLTSLQLPSGDVIDMASGSTVLEALKSAKIPHAAICGGRGRCTTCRIRINEGFENLPPPDETEAAALARIKAEPRVRLACQLRPTTDISISPLLPATVTAKAAQRSAGGVSGSEEKVAIVFIDLRGSTKLGEDRLPYDVVFILNQFFAEMSAALKDTGGHYAQFNGDGLMAIYGLETSFRQGCEDAIRGAIAMLQRLDKLNETLKAELKQPMHMGIGIHAGEAIVGEMGPPHSPIVSSIGDNVNIAARLEAATKTFNCPLIVSDKVATKSRIDFSDHPRETIDVRGRVGTLEAWCVTDWQKLISKLPDSTPKAGK